jgi:signal transduction histidine kinase
MLSKLIEYSPIVGSSDDIRRGRLLNIMLVGVGFIAAGALLLLIVTDALQLMEHTAFLYIAVISLVAGVAALYWLNQRGYVSLASAIFLVLLTLVISFSDRPVELVAGRSLTFFVIPIMMSSFLLHSSASFLVALLIALEHAIIWNIMELNISFSPFGMIGFFVFALISWLAARSLEAALLEAREVNRHLDELVDERTKELADANLQLEDQARELAQVNLRLTELDQLKSKFVSDVSHELRTPISNLTIYLEMLETAKPERRERYRTVLQEETRRLDTLVSDILDLSRMEMGVTKIEFGWINLNDIVDQVVTANQPRADVKDVMISFEPGDDLPAVWADANQINQAINNLVGNAVNYTPKGNIWVSTQVDTTADCLCLRVKDTGFGIKDEDKPHLFERFYRGAQAGQSTIPGTGLGLAITKEIIEGHGGTIELESALGEGTTFTVTLPLGKPENDSATLRG